MHIMPELGKQSIIVPIVKKAAEQRVMSNIRPISLQTAITKLLSKLLAKRLGAVFATHPVLHKAQEALCGGSSFKCVDVALDVWESAKKHKRSCYNVFYDIMAAYDSVRHEDATCLAATRAT